MAKQRLQGPFKPSLGKRPQIPLLQQKEKAAYDAEMLYQTRAAQRAEEIRQRDDLLQSIGIKNAKTDGFAQNAADFIVDHRGHVVKDAATLAALTGGAVATGGLLNAYSQQQQEGLPSGPLGTLGRGAYNAVDAMSQIPIAGMGQDPYAAARNNLRDAGEALGSARVIEALALDQIDEMAVVEDGMKQLHPEIAARIDQKANELMQIQYEAAGGEPRDYNPEKAYTDAIKIVEAEIRAGS